MRTNHAGGIGGLLSVLLISSLFQSRAGVMDHWTTRQVSTNWFGLEHVVYGNGRYVAYGTYSDYGALMSSEDGINWALRLDGKAPSANGFSFAASMHFAHGRFFAFGGFG